VAIQTEEWDRLVAEINSLPQAFRDVAATAFRMGHEEGWWLARTDPDSTVSPPGHEKEVNPFNKPLPEEPANDPEA
jgi:hypothetical protein